MARCNTRFLEELNKKITYAGARANSSLHNVNQIHNEINKLKLKPYVDPYERRRLIYYEESAENGLRKWQRKQQELLVLRGKYIKYLNDLME